MKKRIIIIAGIFLVVIISSIGFYVIGNNSNSIQEFVPIPLKSTYTDRTELINDWGNITSLYKDYLSGNKNEQLVEKAHAKYLEIKADFDTKLEKFPKEPIDEKERLLNSINSGIEWGQDIEIRDYKYKVENGQIEYKDELEKAEAHVNELKRILSELEKNNITVEEAKELAKNSAGE